MSPIRKYDDETRARAVRMYQDRFNEGGISRAAVHREIGELLGVNPATIRGWVRRDLGEGSNLPASTTVESDEVLRLRRENAQLRRANEILKTASAFFAAAELDRKLGQ